MLNIKNLSRKVDRMYGSQAGSEDNFMPLSLNRAASFVKPSAPSTWIKLIVCFVQEQCLESLSFFCSRLVYDSSSPSLPADCISRLYVLCTHREERLRQRGKQSVIANTTIAQKGKGLSNLFPLRYALCAANETETAHITCLLPRN
jgi:hypothetical protein